MSLYIAIRNRKRSYGASNCLLGDKIYVSLNIPTIHKRKNRNFKKFIEDLNYYILLEYICGLSEVEGVFDETFCSNCKCRYITNVLLSYNDI